MVLIAPALFMYNLHGAKQHYSPSAVHSTPFR